MRRLLVRIGFTLCLPRYHHSPKAEEAMLHPWLQQHVHRPRRESGEGKLDAEMLQSLREFPSLSSIQRTALEAIAFSLPAKEISSLRAAFIRMDKVSTHTHTHTRRGRGCHAVRC